MLTEVTLSGMVLVKPSASNLVQLRALKFTSKVLSVTSTAVVVPTGVTVNVVELSVSKKVNDLIVRVAEPVPNTVA